MSSVDFGLVEFDLLTTFAGVDVPFPLRVPSFGSYDVERDTLLAMACETLRRRGLADEDQPLGMAERLVAALAEHTAAVHMSSGDRVWCALIRRGRAVVCTQAGADDMVSTRSVPTDRLADELAGELPALPARRAMPLRLSVPALGRALAASDERGVRAAVRADCPDREQAAALGEVLGEVTGHGRLGVSSCGELVGPELSWVDTEAGRLRVVADREWVSLNPLGVRELTAALRELVAAARR
ncbi:ESX secretion-associated protein EspG [Labedaea rhizosphaerae]|uniref:ESAT-6 protein secretion system EspG family protein n=1 Tax=Labedaea rhizosphaerae TaxID=598644 RepID=A0A4R6S3Q7_LABRH|nr:ESX secretion-associated protein EspG [Labedaea rhizosphaerae]TDP93854.1 ESAT-6 protein secretion system EspG family protein [Labedaea rhizosphaerae]